MTKENKIDEYTIKELTDIYNRFSIVVEELKTRNGKVSTPILDLIDKINKLSVEI